MSLDELIVQKKRLEYERDHPKPSKEQKEALKELIKDQVDKIWIGLNIYKRTEFKVYADPVKYVIWCVMRDIDKGIYDGKKVTIGDIERYLF